MCDAWTASPMLRRFRKQPWTAYQHSGLLRDRPGRTGCDRRRPVGHVLPERWLHDALLREVHVQRRLYVQRTDVADGDRRPACPVHDVDRSRHRASGHRAPRHPRPTRRVVRAIGLSDLIRGATLDGDGRVLQLRVHRLGARTHGRGRVPRYLESRAWTGSSDFSRRRWSAGRAA